MSRVFYAASKQKWAAILTIACLVFGALPAFASSAGTAGDLRGDAKEVQARPLSTFASWQELQLHDGSRSGVHLVRVRLDDPFLQIRMASPSPLIGGNKTVTAYAGQDIMPGNSVVASVNGDFFFTGGTFAGLPTGMLIRNGALVTYRPGQPALVLLKDDRVWIGKPELEMWISIHDESGQETARRTLNAVNKPRGLNELVLYTPEYGDSTKTNEWGAEVLLTGISLPLFADENGRIEQEGMSRIYQGEGRGDLPIYPQSVVLSGHGDAAAFLSQHLGQSGKRASLHIEYPENLRQAVSAIGGLPLLVENGRPAALDASDPLVGKPAPRTVAALTNAGELWLMVVDGRGGQGREGWTLTELAGWLVQQGVQSAINLDGGGSSTLALRGPASWALSVVNRPSDGGQRRVANALQIVSTAPQGKTRDLYLETDSQWILPGGRVHLNIFARDEYENPVVVDSKDVDWNLDRALSLSEDKKTVQVKPEVSPGEIKIEADWNRLSAATHLRVPRAEEIARVEINLSDQTMTAGREIDLSPTVYAVTGEIIPAGNEAFTWQVEGDSLRFSESDGEANRLKAVAPGKADLALLYLGKPLQTWTVAVTEAGQAEPPAETPGQPVDPVPGEEVAEFPDLAGHWAKDTVTALARIGVISGYPDGTVRPQNRVTRAEFVKMLVGAMRDKFENDPVTPVPVTLSDFDRLPDWARNEIERAALHAVVNGLADGAFHPERPLSRQEAVTMIVRSMDTAYRLQIEPRFPLPFSDADSIGDWAAPFAALSVGAGIIEGYADETFRPQAAISRAEAAAMLQRLLSRHESPVA